MRLLMLTLLVMTLAGCDVRIDDIGGPNKGQSQVAREIPIVNPPVSLREQNWTKHNEGSCVWATATTLARWQGRHYLAEHMRRTHGGGEWPSHFHETLDREGVRFAYTTTADMSFVDWACRTRRGCGAVVQGGSHMVTVVHADERWVGLLDPNEIEHVRWVPRETFEAEFTHSGGWAFCLIYTPSPPL